MPNELGIRKQILAALNKHIIPQLYDRPIAQLLANPPFHFVGMEQVIERKKLLLDKKGNPLNVRLDWKLEHLSARRMALLGFSYSGSSVERIGITRQIARDLRQHNLPIPPGISAFHIKSPGVLFVPPHIPHDGQSLSKGNSVHRMLLLWFAEEELWVTHHDATTGGTHNLHVTDPAFQRLKNLYIGALKGDSFSLSQMLLSDLMKHLSNYLKQHRAHISNSAWPLFGTKQILVAPHVSARNSEYCHQVIDYIQFHMNTPLSLETLAEVCGVSVPHLCTIFHKSTGITLMNYVTVHRLRAAEMMLIKSSERISDIAKLTGFASSHSFAGAFRRHFGMSASQYRQQNAEKKR